MDRGLFQKKPLSAETAEPGRPSESGALPEQQSASVADADRLDEAPIVELPPRSSRTVSPVALMIGAWLVIGLVGLLYALPGDRPVAPPPQRANANDYEVAAPAAPMTVPATPIPGAIIGVKVAVDATNPFESIVDTRRIDGAPTRLGLALRHQGYAGSDWIEVDLFSRGRLVNSCRRVTLNSHASPNYWCQFPAVGGGPGQFRVILNGFIVGQYGFVVTGRPTEDSVRVDREAGDMAAIDRRQSQRTAPPVPGSPSLATTRDQSPIACVLPSGQEVRISYQACRQQSGVIY